MDKIEQAREMVRQYHERSMGRLLELTGIERIDNWRRWMVYQRLAVQLGIPPEELLFWDKVYECRPFGEA